MAIVFYDENNKVNLIHYKPEQLSEERRSQGIEVLEIPQAEKIDKKVAELYINPTTKELWYEYKDRPLTEEEKIAELEGSVMELTMMLATMGGAE